MNDEQLEHFAKHARVLPRYMETSLAQRPELCARYFAWGSEPNASEWARRNSALAAGTLVRLGRPELVIKTLEEVPEYRYLMVCFALRCSVPDCVAMLQSKSALAFARVLVGVREGDVDLLMPYVLSVVGETVRSLYEFANEEWSRALAKLFPITPAALLDYVDNVYVFAAVGPADEHLWEALRASGLYYQARLFQRDKAARPALARALCLAVGIDYCPSMCYSVRWPTFAEKLAGHEATLDRLVD